jgi:FKBP-type peptidyl-prolyl cis-trans isomerase FklB
MKRQGVEFDPDAMLRGVKDGLAGAEPAVPPEEMRRVLTDLKRKLLAAEQAKHKEAARENLEKGRAFLESNAKKEGVVVLPSGLQYQVLQPGNGQSPGRSDTVTVHYRGALLDGTEFDSSHRRGKPATLSLDRVIKGWAEGLPLMKPGATYRFFVPPELAYGEHGAGNLIAPNSTLIFDIELIAVGSAP